MTFLILANPTNEECTAFAKCLCEKLSGSSARVYVNPEDDISFDYILVVGGDGTVLRFLDVIMKYGAPVIGINFGHRGYLTACEPEQVVCLIEEIGKGCVPTFERRLLLECEVISEKGEIKKTFRGLNEVFLGRGEMCRAIDFSLDINESSVLSFPADGIIVATPTGSTAYNFSASGPILMPWAKNLVITPVCASALMRSSLVAASDDVIEIKMAKKTGGDEAADSPLLVCDGYKKYNMEFSDTARIMRSREELQIYCGDGGDFLRLLQRKMMI